jgi:hypothetical protein
MSDEEWSIRLNEWYWLHDKRLKEKKQILKEALSETFGQKKT